MHVAVLIPSETSHPHLSRLLLIVRSRRSHSTLAKTDRRTESLVQEHAHTLRSFGDTKESKKKKTKMGGCIRTCTSGMVILIGLLSLLLLMPTQGNLTRIDLLESTLTNAVSHAATLLLTDETPFSSVRGALRDMSKCVARSHDEDVPSCVPGPAHWVAAHLLVLTDVRTWVSPPDIDDEAGVVFEVMKRRLAPKVRTDQCGEKERPRAE